MKTYTRHVSLFALALVAVGVLAVADAADATVPTVYIAIGVVAIIVCAAIDPDLFRQHANWLNAAWGSILLVLIVGMVNYLGNAHPKRYDATVGKLHSLSDLTVESLQGLEQDVRVTAFMEGGEDETLEGMLKQYVFHDDSFDYEMVDPDRDPEKTRNYGIKAYNTVVVESGEKQQRITELTENELTNAMLRVIRDREAFVYLTVGHGEKGLAETNVGLSRLRDRLQEIDYVVEDSLFLARRGNVPENCAVLVIAGPRVPFLSNEIDAIKQYLESGGSVIALLDPVYESGLRDILLDWGVQLGDDFVVDPTNRNFLNPVSAVYDGKHPIVRRHRERGMATVFPMARSVWLKETEGITGTQLTATGSRSWADTDLSALTPGGPNPNYAKDIDRAGPIVLGVATSSEDNGGRLVVFGDSEFASNLAFDVEGNGDLMLNALSWLAEDEGLISIRPRRPGFSPISLSDSQLQWIFWLGVIALPLLVVPIALYVLPGRGRWSMRDLTAATIGFALSVGIVALVNFIGGRYHTRVDVTADGLFTLSPKTKELMDRVERQDRLIRVKAFSEAEIHAMQFRELLNEYRYETRNFSYEVIDRQKQPLEWTQYDVTTGGTSIVEVTADGKTFTERIDQLSEETFSNAIHSGLNARERGLIFTGGHGEGSLTKSEGDGFSILNGRLKELNARIEEGLDFAEELPEANHTVVVLGPRQPFSTTEAVALEAHLRKGGDALVLVDPGVDSGLEEVLTTYGVELHDDLVVDRSGIGQLLSALGQVALADEKVPSVLQYGSHPITERIGTMSFFPLARSVSVIDDQPPEHEAMALAYTDRSSWGETGDGQIEFNPDSERLGPLSLAVAVRAEPDSGAQSGEKTRLVVFGDSDFVRNEYFSQQANGELLMSSLKWLTENEDRLTISDRRPSFTPIQVEGDGTSVLVIVFVLSFGVALLGFVISYQAYSAGFLTWLLYSYLTGAVFFLLVATKSTTDGGHVEGITYLVLANALAMTGFGLVRRQPWSWAAGLVLVVLVLVAGYIAVPLEVMQMLAGPLYAKVLLLTVGAWWLANGCILVWLKKDFTVQNAVTEIE